MKIDINKHIINNRSIKQTYKSQITNTQYKIYRKHSANKPFTWQEDGGQALYEELKCIDKGVSHAHRKGSM